MNHLELKLNAVSSNLVNMDNQNKKILLNSEEAIKLVNLNDLIYCKREGEKTRIYMINEDEMLIDKAFEEYLNLLKDYDFFKLHPDYLINLGHLFSFEKSEHVQMTDQSHIPADPETMVLLRQTIEAIK